MLAILPARKGSKGIHNKNTKILNGKPLIAWTLESLIQSKKVSEILVTTNDDKVVDICNHYKINVPFKRPNYLCTDKALAINVYKHAINFINKKRSNKIKEFIVTLPTSPLRTSKHIDDAIRLYKKAKADSLISCKKLDFPSDWIFNIKKNYYIIKNKRSKNSNRQDLEFQFIPNGAIYILKFDILKKLKSYYTEKTVAFIMERNESVDIDDIDDFNYASYLMKNKK